MFFHFSGLLSWWLVSCNRMLRGTRWHADGVPKPTGGENRRAVICSHNAVVRKPRFESQSPKYHWESQRSDAPFTSDLFFFSPQCKMGMTSYLSCWRRSRAKVSICSAEAAPVVAWAEAILASDCETFSGQALLISSSAHKALLFWGSYEK